MEETTLGCDQEMTPSGSLPTQRGGNRKLRLFIGFWFCLFLYFAVQVAQPGPRNFNILDKGPGAEHRPRAHFILGFGGQRANNQKVRLHPWVCWRSLPTGTVGGGGRISQNHSWQGSCRGEGVGGLLRPMALPGQRRRGDRSGLHGMQARAPLAVGKELGVADARAQPALSSA